MISKEVLTTINLPEATLFKTGKVRSVYDCGENLLIVSSDRVSAFDVVMQNGIPYKGEVLTKLSEFWFHKTKHIIKNHLISTAVDQYPAHLQQYVDIIDGRSMLVKKCDLIPVECVVRGYLIGSGWKDYQDTGSVCGIPLPAGLEKACKLPEPIFTPAFKAEAGEHDYNISFQEMIDIVGKQRADFLKDISLQLYAFGRDYAAEKGIILADTKFEFGCIGDEIILIDEVLTPDSSRYWPASDYQPGGSPPSYDKQILRDFLETLTWDKQPPGPTLPDAVVTNITNTYKEIVDVLHQ